MKEEDLNRIEMVLIRWSSAIEGEDLERAISWCIEKRKISARIISFARELLNEEENYGKR